MVDDHGAVPTTSTPDGQQAEQDPKQSQSTQLVAFALDRCSFFHDSNRDVFAQVRSTGEIHRLDSQRFRDWLMSTFYSDERKSLRDQSVREAVGTLTGIGRYEGERRDVHTRVACHEDAYYLDLATPGDNRAVRITPGNWEIVTQPPVMFIRPDAVQPLPEPSRCGDIRLLFAVVNMPASHHLLTIAWLCECLRPNTPFPLLELIGEAGSAKSTTQRLLRRLIDPNACELRSSPRSVEDLFVGAGQAHVISMENVSHLPPAVQDALCMIATGGGYARRKLYTDADESVIQVKRPVVINGITATVTQQDLVDRAVTVDLPLITDRLEADVLLQQFERTHASILGGLLDTFAAALARLPQVELPTGRRPRLIEFARLGCGVAEALGETGTSFMDQFDSSRVDAVHRTLDASPAAAALVEWFDARGRKEIALPVKELLSQVESFRIGAEAWPRSPKGFADALRRAAPALRQIGIECRGLPKYAGVVRWVVRGLSSPSGPGSPGHPESAGPTASQDVRTLRTSFEPSFSEELPL